MAQPLAVTFIAGSSGDWRIERLSAVAGDPLPAATHLSVGNEAPYTAKCSWQLRGIVSHTRYTTAQELARLNVVSPPLRRPEATCAALIPIRKSDAWWSMAQDERRAIFEERSGHIAKSMPYLPAIARRLHHARDLGEPFDFLTWFEYAPQHADAFEELVAELRASAEWRHVEREVDIRLRRVAR
jgi:chlorite dismutase